jgi:hypothetical protein
MAGSEVDVLDAPACPLLGLEGDPRTHHTFPNARHRCFANGPATTTGPDRQSDYCLSARFDLCDRFLASRARAATDSSRP